METRETGEDREERNGRPATQSWGDIFVAACPKGWTAAADILADALYERVIL
jgi:hypothetical protein